jgi:hypothetical protein
VYLVDFLGFALPIAHIICESRAISGDFKAEPLDFLSYHDRLHFFQRRFHKCR